VNVEVHIFLTSPQVGIEWSGSSLCRFTHGTHWIGGCVELRAGLDDMEKRKSLTLPRLEFRLLVRPTRSQLLQRLRYPGFYKYQEYTEKLHEKALGNPELRRTNESATFSLKKATQNLETKIVSKLPHAFFMFS
jgi:hypothetical protein